MKKKLILLVVFLFIFISIVWYSLPGIKEEIVDVPKVSTDMTTTETVFEAIELKSQKDFKLIGESVFIGSGFEPGFAFKINMAGTKFGVDLDSQYGETKYVGYLDLASQSTTTKVFAGKMLDKNDQVVDGLFAIVSKACTMPSGDEVPFSVDIKAGPEVLSGCAEMK